MHFAANGTEPLTFNQDVDNPIGDILKVCTLRLSNADLLRGYKQDRGRSFLLVHGMCDGFHAAVGKCALP